MSESDVVTIRRQRLKSFIDAKFGGKQTSFAGEYDVNPGELSGLLRSKHFGEKKARSLEAKLGIPPLWMDGLAADNVPTVQEPSAEYSVYAELNAAWDLLTQDEQADFLAQIKARAVHNKAVMDQLSVRMRTVNVNERRLAQAGIPFADRRRKTDAQ